MDIVEMDAASNNGVDNIRALREDAIFSPTSVRKRVYIVDEVHMLSIGAFNALLKILEEPPEHLMFILATTELNKVPATILSRCQRYSFKRISVPQIRDRLNYVASQEPFELDTDAAEFIAQLSDGGMRDALSIFDQVAAFCQGNITYKQTIADLNVLDTDYYFKLVDYFLSGDIPSLMLTFNEVLSKGFDGSYFIGGLNSHLRNLLISKDASTVSLLETSDEIRQQYLTQAQKCDVRFLYGAMRKCTDCDLNYKNSQNRRLLIELTLIEISQLAEGDTVSPK